MLALTFRTDEEEPVLLDPMTGRCYEFEEAGLPESLKEFLLALASSPALRAAAAEGTAA